MYDLVPPPGAMTIGETGIRLRFKPKKLLRGVTRRAGRIARGAARGVKKTGKFVAKKAAAAAKAVARLAAKPIRNMFRKLGMRRARLLSWKGRRSLQPNAAEKAQASAWTIARMRRNPAGRLGIVILKATWGTSVGQHSESIVGMTGAEIAAAAAAVVGAIAALLQSLNKPGQAPADPRAGEREDTESPAEAPAEAPADAPAEEPEEAPSAGNTYGNTLGVLTPAWNMKKAGWKMPYRYVTLAEANAVVDKLMRAERFGVKLYPTRDAAEIELMSRMYKRGIGIVTDDAALPGAEKEARRYGGLAQLAGMKKAYRARYAREAEEARRADEAAAQPEAVEARARAVRRFGKKAYRKYRDDYTLGDHCGLGVCTPDCKCYSKTAGWGLLPP